MKFFIGVFMLVLSMSISSAAAPAAYTFPVQATNGQEIQLGSALLIDPASGLYMTAYHTLKNVPGGTLSVHVQGIDRTVDVVGIYKKGDILLFLGPKVAGLPKLPIVLPNKEDQMVAVGYRPQLDVMTLRVSNGVASEVSLWMLQTTALGEGGMSGSGLFSADGTKIHGLTTQMYVESKKIVGVNADLMRFCLEVTKDRMPNEIVKIDKLMPKG